MKWILFSFALAWSALMAAPAAHAKGKVEAKEAFRRSTQHYNLGNFTQALEGFKEAYLDFPDPSFLFNIGQCQRQLGQKQEAVLSYKAYLREAPNTPNHDEVQSLIASLEKVIHEDEVAKNTRPQGTFGPGETPPSEPATKIAVTRTENVAVTSAPNPTPIYKKWWLWTIVAVGVVGLGVGLGVGLSASSTNYPSGAFTDGTIRF